MTALAPLLAAAILVMAAGVLTAQRRWQRTLIGRAVDSAPRTAGPAPDLLYFTSDTCTVCHVAQRPALERLRALVGDVRVREIDVAADPSTARSYRVMTLPTIVVLDRDGTATAVNAGFVNEGTLRDQVLSAREATRGLAAAAR